MDNEEKVLYLQKNKLFHTDKSLQYRLMSRCFMNILTKNNHMDTRKRNLLGLAIGVGMLFNTACTNDEPSVNEQPPIVPDNEMTEMLKAQRIVAWNLASQIATENKDDNFVFSPLSLNIAMSMLNAGAQDDCARELASFLHYDNVDSQNKYFQQILANIPYIDNRSTLRIANSLWLDKMIAVKESYQQDINKYYNADILTTDLNGANLNSKINAWISEQTDGLIQSHYPEGYDGKSNLRLVNAIYFKSPWTDPFIKGDTKRERFTNSDGTKVTVDMMTSSFKTRKYAELNGASAITLPFGNGSFNATFILPPEGTSVDEYLSTSEIDNIIFAAKSSIVQISLPKFEVENSFDFKGILEKLGVRSIFEPQNWPGMLETENPEYKVNQILQSCKIIINEDGGEMASSTSVEGAVTSTEPKIFNANRPFVYVIWEKACKLPLIVGSIQKF